MTAIRIIFLILSIASIVIIWWGFKKSSPAATANNPHSPADTAPKRSKWRISGMVFGIVVAIVVAIIVFVHGYNMVSDFFNKEVEFPTSGQGHATMEKPIKAYLDPLKSYTRVLGKGYAKFVLASNPNQFFLCNEKPGVNSKHIEEWWSMPAGDYFVYPYEKEKIIFSWW